MKILFVFLTLQFIFASEPMQFGKGEFSSSPVRLDVIKKDFDKYKSKNIVMTGQVSKVCKMSGCWFELADGSNSVRITMKDYGFTVPKDILNKSVKVFGLMEQKELPIKVAKHLLKDEGAPQSEIDKIDKPQKVFEFVATGVLVL